MTAPLSAPGGPAAQQQAADAVVARCLDGALAPEVAVSLLLLGDDPHAVPDVRGATQLAAAAVAAAGRARRRLRTLSADAGDAERRARLDALVGLLGAVTPGAARVAAMARGPTAGDPDAVRRLFDAAVAQSEEASVALYSLGDPQLLARATDEVVRWMEARRLVAPGRRLLEVGCGIGRFEARLAPHAALAVGVDVSPGMLAAARRRAGHLAPAAFVQTAGRDLAMFADAAFDLVFAIDAMPYVVAGGPALVDATFAEMRRAVRPGGDMLVINHSYRNDLAADRADVRALAARHGLEVLEAGVQPFAHWDGAVFLLRRLAEADGAPEAAESACLTHHPGTGLTPRPTAPAPRVDDGALLAELVVEDHALAALVPAWEALHARCPDATPFQSPAWLVPWRRYLGSGALHTVAVRDAADGRLVGLVPAFTFDDAGGNGPGSDGVGATRTLALLGAGITDYGDALFDPAYRDAALARAVRALGDAADAGAWRAAAFDELRDTSPLLDTTVWPAGLRATVARQSVAPQRALPGSWDAFAATLGGAFRRKLNMGANRLRRAPGAECAVADAASLPALLDALFALHEARWQSRGEAGVLADPRLRPFHGEAAAGFLARGWLRLRVLRIDGQPAAVLYGLHHAGRAYCYLSGIAPDLEYYSPGVAIVRAAVEGAVAEGCTALDFLRGGERYKYLWGVQDTQSWRLTLARG